MTRCICIYLYIMLSVWQVFSLLNPNNPWNRYFYCPGFTDEESKEKGVYHFCPWLCSQGVEPAFEPRQPGFPAHCFHIPSSAPWLLSWPGTLDWGSMGRYVLEGPTCSNRWLSIKVCALPLALGDLDLHPHPIPLWLPMKRAQCSLPILNDDQLSQVAWDWEVSRDSGLSMLKPKIISGKQGQLVTLAERRGQGACLSHAQSWLCHSPTLQLWPSHLTSLCLYFLTCEIGIIIIVPTL